METLPEPIEIRSDKDGTITRVFWKIKNDNELVKVTQVVKVITDTVKQRSSIVERRKRMQNHRFGNVSLNNNKNVTIEDTHEVSIVDPNDTSINDDDGGAGLLSKGLKVFQEKRLKRELEKKLDIDSKSPTEKNNVYIPPAKRQNNSVSNKDTNIINYYSIRISNISCEIKQDDIYQLCQSFGPINEINIPYDRQTNQGRGFAYVRFKQKECAKQAMDILNGYGYDYRILKVEYAKKRTPSTKA